MVMCSYRYEIVLTEELISITWECQQKTLITDTDSLLNSNYFPLQIQISGSKRSNAVIISDFSSRPWRNLPPMGDIHGDPQTSPQHADPHGLVLPL